MVSCGLRQAAVCKPIYLFFNPLAIVMPAALAASITMADGDVAPACRLRQARGVPEKE